MVVLVVIEVKKYGSRIVYKSYWSRFLVVITTAQPWHMPGFSRGWLGTQLSVLTSSTTLLWSQHQHGGFTYRAPCPTFTCRQWCAVPVRPSVWTSPVNDDISASLQLVVMMGSVALNTRTKCIPTLRYWSLLTKTGRHHEFTFKRCPLRVALTKPAPSQWKH